MDPLVFWLQAQSGTYDNKKWKKVTAISQFCLQTNNGLFLFFTESKSPFVKRLGAMTAWAVKTIHQVSVLSSITLKSTAIMPFFWQADNIVRGVRGHQAAMFPFKSEWWWIFFALLAFIVLNRKIVHDTRLPSPSTLLPIPSIPSNLCLPLIK